MKLKTIVHKAEEGGYWAEIPAIPGCASQGETMEELLENLQEAVKAAFPSPLDEYTLSESDEVLEIAV